MAHNLLVGFCPVCRSLFFPDEAINNSHPRFATVTRNIRERRGEKVVINVPIYVDKNTPQPFIEQLPVEGSENMKYVLAINVYAISKQNRIVIGSCGSDV